MDFVKAFDKLRQHELLKLDCYGIRENALKWTEAFLMHRKHIIIDCKSSEWVDVKSSVTHSTVIWGLMNFCFMIVPELIKEPHTHIKILTIG